MHSKQTEYQQQDKVQSKYSGQTYQGVHKYTQNQLDYACISGIPSIVNILVCILIHLEKESSIKVNEILL